MAEAYSWPEGSITFYTGSHVPTTSAIQAYAKNINATRAYGWVNNETMARAYYNVLTGQRADVSIGAAYTFGGVALQILESATAVHMKLNHTGVNGSAGIFLYSGVFDSLSINGMENGIFEWTLTYHANAWSAF